MWVLTVWPVEARIVTRVVVLAGAKRIAGHVQLELFGDVRGGAVRGDEVMAMIVLAKSGDSKHGGPAPDATGLATQLVTHCLSHLAYFKAPGYLSFVSELPLTATQKVQRAALRERACAVLDAMGDDTGAPSCVDLRTLKKRGAADV